MEQICISTTDHPARNDKNILSPQHPLLNEADSALNDNEDVQMTDEQVPSAMEYVNDFLLPLVPSGNNNNYGYFVLQSTSSCEQSSAPDVTN